MRKGDLDVDPRGLIFEAYRMDISPADCRTIFLDWALGLDDPAGPTEIRALLEHYSPLHPDHPMTRILHEAMVPFEGAPARRGGWRRRHGTD